MAPELLLARFTFTPPSTNRVDVYSLGMMMWEMLAGRTPWAECESEAAMIMLVVRDAQAAMSGGTRAWQECAFTDFSWRRRLRAQVDEGRRPPLPLPAAKDAGGSGPLPAVDLDGVAASLDALPELNLIINECWQQRALRRPPASAVHARLLALLQSQG